MWHIQIIETHNTPEKKMSNVSIFYKNENFIVYAREWEAGNTVYDLKEKKTGKMHYTWSVDAMDALRCVVDANRSLIGAA